uniref:protein BASIC PENTACYSTEINE2-like n=1 Tax=Erigeron canadensis TaxID=72917 RepID=UPI001CB9982A|nr:protein BASIC PENTACYSTEINE2-like [Erigeron canadensis]
MDDDVLPMRNWGTYEASYKEPHGLQLMLPVRDHSDSKPFLSQRESFLMVNLNGPGYQLPHTHMVPVSPLPLNLRDNWMPRERFAQMQQHMRSGSPNFSRIANTSASQSIQMVPPLDLLKGHEMSMSVEDSVVTRKDSGGSGNSGTSGGGGGGGSMKKRGAMTTPKMLKTKNPKKNPTTPKQNNNTIGHRARTMRKSIDVVINGIDMDISGIPIPVCSCTGAPQQCYRWGLGGWQSACCTTTISMYPLPLSTKRRGARIAGRKMSKGAFKKVLEKLASKGYNFTNAIDLRSHWAKHGSNKFVTIFA